MTRAEWDALNAARVARVRAEVQRALAEECAARAYLARVAVEGPLIRLVEAERRVRAELAAEAAEALRTSLRVEIMVPWLALRR